MNSTKESAAQPATKQESGAIATPLLRPLENLGRRLGNAGMRALVQAKLAVSDPNDLYEQEADRVADQVMRMPATSLVQRKCAKWERAEDMTDLDPNAALDNIAIEVEFETRSPERVNQWLFDQGAECFIAYEHNGLLRPTGEPPPIPRPPAAPRDDDTLP